MSGTYRMRDLPLHRAPRKSKKEKEKPSCMMQGGHSRIQQGYRFVVRAGDVSAQLRGLYKVYIRFILWMTLFVLDIYRDTYVKRNSLTSLINNRVPLHL